MPETPPAQYYDLGVWDETKVYRGDYTVDENGQTILRPGGPDVVNWMGTKWVANYYHIGINPAVDRPGESGFWRLFDSSQPAIYDLVFPNAVTGMKAGFVDDDEISVFWKDAYVPGQGEVLYYNIFVDGVKVGNTQNNSYTISGLDASKTYNIQVQPINQHVIDETINGRSVPALPAGLPVTTDAVQETNGKYYSGYVDMTHPDTNIVDLVRDSGLRDLTLAFMQSDNSNLDANGDLIAGKKPTLAWGGIALTDKPTNVLIEQIAQVKDLGGTVTIAFGGYNGRDPATSAGQYADHLFAAGGVTQAQADAVAAKHLQSLYQSVMDTYGVNHFDFDVENSVFKLNESLKYPSVDDSHANHIRNLALVGLKAENPDLYISYTVATLPDGVSDQAATLRDDGPAGPSGNRWVEGGSGNVEAMLAQAKADGVAINTVNIMAMDYFDGAAANPDMGANAISAAKAMYALLTSLGLDAKVGVTPMLGQNDAYNGNTHGNEVFHLSDAVDLVNFFQSTPWIAGFGAWQVTRDRAGSDNPNVNNPAGVGAPPVHNHSGVAQGEFAFSRILEQIGLYTRNGGAGDDVITGRSNTTAETLSGNGGNDTLKGGLGADTLDGGSGSDTADYTDKTTSVVVTLNGATNATVTVGGVAEDTVRNIENVLGGSGADTLTGDAAANNLSGGAGNDMLKGGGGNDTINGLSGIDTVDYRDKTTTVVVQLAGSVSSTVTVGGVAEDVIRWVENVEGGSASDSLRGDNVANVLRGNAGNDVLKGLGGADTLYGDAGIDTADFTDKSTAVVVTLNGANLVNVTVGGVLEDRIAGIEYVYGGSAADTLTGDSGANLLRGGGGADVINGGAGMDAIDFRDKTVSVLVNLNGANESRATVGGVQEDYLRNIESIYGGQSADVLFGDGLNNLLSGGAGADLLKGAAGADSLYGGAGADTFRYDLTSDSTVAATGRDTIFDFKRADGDKIDLSGMDANTAAGGEQAFVLGAMGTAGRLAITANGTGSWLVQGDVDGGGADFAIVVNTLDTLNSGDFIL